MRSYSPVDRFLMHADTALRTVLGKPKSTARSYPAASISECELDKQQKNHINGLMRVNHAGEIAAQALYQGQSLTARDAAIRDTLAQAAAEENDHLLWTEQRLQELGGHTSYLAPAWYAGSFAIGALAGALGDRWNLGFLAETEHQVSRHLDDHLSKLPEQDRRSRAILEQMRTDEARHATTALEHGGAVLPYPVKKLMTAVSKVMTKTAYWI